MIDPNTLRLAEKLARSISKRSRLTSDEISHEATIMTGGDPASAGIVAQLAKWAAPFFTESQIETARDHGGMIAAFHEITDPHKNDTEH